jgi:AraC-like DNA-binding protein
LVSSLTRELARHLDDWDVAAGPRLGSAVMDLFTVALADRLDRNKELLAGTSQRALLTRIHAFIEAHLDDSELSPGTIAAAHFISLRYLYKLFELHERSVAGWILQRRLERCRRDLLDPNFAEAPVSAIAARWGITNARPTRSSRPSAGSAGRNLAAAEAHRQPRTGGPARPGPPCSC